MMELNDKNFASVEEHLWSSNQRRQLEADKWDSERFIIIGKDAWKIAKDSYLEWIELIHSYIILDFWATSDRHVYIYIYIVSIYIHYIYTYIIYMFLSASAKNLEGMATNQLILNSCRILPRRLCLLRTALSHWSQDIRSKSLHFNFQRKT